MTISSEPPVIRHARPKQPEEHEGAISKQPLMSREMAMVYRFMAIVYCWSILTAIIWGFLVAIGPQDESDIRLPYWFKEFLPYGLAKHIKERDSSKERSYIDKKEQ
ncbi:hypothetical protein CcaCcLH18_00917 [Colletotrichum camelliae]|nr:hypothetical protein CcaCcLH18_00917 [Colletotrichum camelliae]